MVVRYYEFAMGRQLHKIKIRNMGRPVECWMVDKNNYKGMFALMSYCIYWGNGLA